MRRAANSGASCSQIRMTVQPAVASLSFTSWSRPRLRATLSAPRPVRAAFRFKLVRIAEPGDQVRIGVLVRLSGPVQVVKQSRRIPAADHFPNHAERSGTVTECSGAPVPPPHPAAGSPAHRTGQQAPSPRPAAPSHSAAPPPDSNSSPHAAPTRRPPSAPLTQPVTATTPGPGYHELSPASPRRQRHPVLALTALLLRLPRRTLAQTARTEPSLAAEPLPRLAPPHPIDRAHRKPPDRHCEGTRPVPPTHRV